MPNDQELRRQLVSLLRGGQAYMPFDHAVGDFPKDQINMRPHNVGYSFWHILEHLRIAQRDILDYIRGDDYHELEWPEEYWPAKDANTDETGWNQTLQKFRDDQTALITIVQDTTIDLTAPLPHAPQHNILREILVVADHNAYHTGEFAILRGMLGLWPDTQTRP
jgi:hypothetical protein